jgi:hypothetical protein
MSERVDAWLAAAIADAEQRGLPELKPLLEGLAKSTTALRAADSDRRTATTDNRTATDNTDNTDNVTATDNTDNTEKGQG